MKNPLRVWLWRYFQRSIRGYLLNEYPGKQPYLCGVLCRAQHLQPYKSRKILNQFRPVSKGFLNLLLHSIHYFKTAYCYVHFLNLVCNARMHLFNISLGHF